MIYKIYQQPQNTTDNHRIEIDNTVTLAEAVACAELYCDEMFNPVASLKQGQEAIIGYTAYENALGGIELDNEITVKREME